MGANKITLAEVAQMAKTELAKNKAMRTIWCLEFPDGTQCEVKYNYSLPQPYGDQYIYEELRSKDRRVRFSCTCDEKFVIDEICRHLVELGKIEVNRLKPMSETTCAERPKLDDHEYYTWLMMAEDEPRRTIAEKALTEAWINILFATMRRGGHILVMNNRGELVDTIFTPQTPEPFEKLEYLLQVA